MRRAGHTEKSVGLTETRGRLKRKRRRIKRLRLIACCLIILIIVVSGLGYRWRASHRKLPSAPLVAAVESPYSDPPGIILHSSDSPAFVHGVKIDATRLDAIHAHDHPQWATEFEGKVYHIGYHYVVLPDGTVEKGRPDHCKGCHAPHFNDCIGICTVGCFDPDIKYQGWPYRPTDAQVKSITSLCEELMTKYHIPASNVVRHYDTKATWCPGRRYPFGKIKNDLFAFETAHPEIRAAKPIALPSPLFNRD